MSTPGHLRVIFLGSPEFAVPSLQALVDAVRIVLVVTPPDRPSGRGRRVVAPPVARFARERGLPLLQPQSPRRSEVVEALRAVRADLLVTVAYGRIIPNAVLALPPLGAVNAHPSLLPLYRGAAPIPRAIADGQMETGITILFQSDEIDAGDIILQERIPIGPEETAGALERRLADRTAALLCEAIGLIVAGRVSRTPQDHASATYVGKLTKEDGRILWGRPAQAIVNLIRAMDPWPSAYTNRAGKQVKIWRARLEPASPPRADHEPGEPGTVLHVNQDGILMTTGDGVLRLLEVQPEGGRRMSAAAFARGHRVRPGERWGGDGGRESATLLVGGG